MSRRKHRCHFEANSPLVAGRHSLDSGPWTCPTCGLVWREEYSESEGWFWETVEFENIYAQTERPSEAYWLSFADDDGFRGAVIIHATEFTEAVMQASLRGLNPHGEVAGMKIPAAVAATIPEGWKYRLLSREECTSFDKEMTAGKP